MTKKIGVLLGSVIICFLPGIIGSVFTSSNIATWYAGLERPVLSPPNWVFGPVWTILYLLMGISLFLVITSKNNKKKRAYYVFAIQLFLNGLWSFLFFGMNQPLFAFIEIMILWVFILLSLLCFYRINKVAGYLLIPYLLWVSFAMYLNYSIWRIN